MPKRVPLVERGEAGDWTPFESRLFNLISDGYREAGIDMLFSKRLAATQVMLDAFDSYVEGKHQ
jgi:hypothetical protein